MQIKLNTIKATGFGISLTILVALLLSSCGGGRSGEAIHAYPQTITFGAALASLTLPGTATVTVTASASSGLAVKYNSNTPTICTVNTTSGLVTGLTSGACIITANQAGNTDYAPAAQATLTITIYTTSQSINFSTAPALLLYGHATVAASASSGLAVSYSSQTPAVCTVNSTSGLVTNLTVGDCFIAADQAGNAYTTAAPQVTQTLTVSAWTAALTPPETPSNVNATLGNDTIEISFTLPASSGGSPITGYTVSSSPAGLAASGTTSPISLPCPAPCSDYAFAVSASNAQGDSAASAMSDVLTDYNVSVTFTEPDTQPNDTIFTGSFTVNSTNSTVSGLQGILTESMTGPPMATVALTHQLSAVSDGQGGLLVTSFALNTTNTFAEGGFAPGSAGYYYGYPALPNPGAPGGVGNAYIMIDVNLSNPTATPTPAQINQLAYADCMPGGMMGGTCMTGYSGAGTMGGYPKSQTITRK